jgi:hypothetical protein
MSCNARTIQRNKRRWNEKRPPRMSGCDACHNVGSDTEVDLGLWSRTMSAVFRARHGTDFSREAVATRSVQRSTTRKRYQHVAPGWENMGHDQLLQPDSLSPAPPELTGTQLRGTALLPGQCVPPDFVSEENLVQAAEQPRSRQRRGAHIESSVPSPTRHLQTRAGRWGAVRPLPASGLNRSRSSLREPSCQINRAVLIS